MEQDWDFYLLRVDDQPASTYLDLALARIAPVADQPVITYVSVTMRAPRADGLSSNEEFDALIALEDALAGALQAGGAAIYAGIAPDGDGFKLGRATDWIDDCDGLVRGKGQRCFLVGDRAVPVMELTGLRFQSREAA